jgi:hypothetical protein
MQILNGLRLRNSTEKRKAMLNTRNDGAKTIENIARGEVKKRVAVPRRYSALPANHGQLAARSE